MLECDGLGQGITDNLSIVHSLGNEGTAWLMSQPLSHNILSQIFGILFKTNYKIHHKKCGGQRSKLDAPWQLSANTDLFKIVQKPFNSKN